MRRLLYVSSSRSPWFESPDAAEHFKAAPYSVDAIGYNLEKLGWTVGWAGYATTHNPWTLAKKIDDFKPDIIYTYGSLIALHPLFCRRFLCKQKSFKVVHGWDDPYGRIWNELFGWPGKVFMNWMEKRIVKNSDGVVTLSYELQKKGRRWGIDCHYIPNGADPIDEGVENRCRCRADGLILTGRFNLVYTGDKARWKRTKDICRAMRELPKDVKLYMTGREAEHLKSYYSENCISLGWLTKEEQLAVMSQADAFVVTSNQDCNAKLQEYLRWKKPILGFDGEANNFFKNGHNALLAKNGDYAPLIRRLIDEPDLGATLVANAEKEIPVYTWAEIAQQFDSYFNDLISLRHAQSTRENLDVGQQDDRCRLHPFAPRRERVLSDLRRIRVLGEKAVALAREPADRSAKDTLRELIDCAKACGLYLSSEEVSGLGEPVYIRTGESEVYYSQSEHAYYKAKNPAAKASIKQTTLSDWFYEHIIHNILFPETAYEFIGVTEQVGEIRIILKQQDISTEQAPTNDQIAHHLAALGLIPIDRFFFGNADLAVTDVSATSDNVLLGDDNRLYFIDPLIRLKRPAREVIDILVGE